MGKMKKFSGKLFEINLRHIRIIIGICFTMILSIITSVLLGKFIDVLGSGKFSGRENVYYIVGLFVLTILSLTCTLFFVKWFPLKLQLKKAIRKRLLYCWTICFNNLIVDLYIVFC